MECFIFTFLLFHFFPFSTSFESLTLENEHSGGLCLFQEGKNVQLNIFPFKQNFILNARLYENKFF